ncbi:DNA cytosine methyltransferase [Pseudomonas costantinii]|uniref:DNA (cytosine-5-)-methyltransferase n=1 Tax=Pseudomonas costantinii TaxID=168469 RepID=A0A1S2V2C5_9PSED|nr:DNA cytosine methyltransferase [Pseudomonas costantinii]OIN52922.1 cytosine methyltransferase [Pseudomonas costantinii]SED27744.1 DNA (cytosine-5)-methyltransferase 1 [Pseudomonas costantinii]
MEITYGSVCSGIEAATQGWHPLGMRAAWFAEIEPFPSAVLAHHYPDVPNHGDMTKLAALVLAGKIPAPDVLVGGTPCQAFSVAGMREGLTDPRGALTIKYVELADAVDYVRAGQRKPASVIVWENVPGVLSDKGNAFGCFLGALAGEDCELQPPGKKWQDAGCVYGPKRTIAWRVLDAQYFGLAQRRRRVFVVASARGGFDPTEVLFEREGVRRDTAPRRGQGQDVTGTAPFGPALQCGEGCEYVFPEQLGAYGCPSCEGDFGPAVSMFGGIPAFGAGRMSGSIEKSGTLTHHEGRNDLDSETFFVQEKPVNALTANGVGTCGADDNQAQAGHLIAGTLNANGKAAGSATSQDAESGLLVVHGTQDPCVSDKLAFALGRNNGQENAVLAFSCKDHGADAGEIAPTLRAMNHSGSHPNAGGQVAVCITGDITHTLKAEGFDGSDDGTGRGQPIVAALSPTLRAGNMRNNSNPATEADMLVGGSQVRRLVPVECERLQGMADHYTLIPWRGKPASECPDGPRYKAIGNSKAVTVVRWIGRRLLQQL